MYVRSINVTRLHAVKTFQKTMRIGDFFYCHTTNRETAIVFLKNPVFVIQFQCAENIHFVPKGWQAILIRFEFEIRIFCICFIEI